MASVSVINIGALVPLLILFYLLAVMQALHISFTILQKGTQPIWVVVSYEALLFIHIVLSAIVAQAALGGFGMPFLDLRFASVPVAALLWIHAGIAIFGIFICIRLRRLTMVSHVLVLILSTPPFLHLLGDLWWMVLILDAFVFLVRGIAALIYDIRRQTILVSRLSIVEALNALPEGLLYAHEGGRVLLMNDAMRSALLQLGLPTDLADARSLWNSLQHKASLGYAPDAILPEGIRLRISHTEIRLFTMKSSVFHRRRFWQMFALDVTEEEHLNFDIERTNYFLEKAGEELQESLEDLQETAENEVLLRMRSRVHDIIGQRLSIFHRYLEDGGVSDESLEEVRMLLNTILDDLVVYESSDPETELAAIVEAFLLVGVDFSFQGELPRDATAASVFVDVIREATTNAVKHGQASLVSVCIKDLDDGIILEITSDGLVFEERISEGKGLPGMRYAAQRIGASFSYQTGPPFTIRVQLPHEKEAQHDTYHDR